MADPQTRDADLVVVGAGLAGLSAARAASAAGVEVVVVEARERVGGRVLNEDIGDGNVVEVGGQWIGPTQDRLAALAAELGVGTFPTYAGGQNVIEYSGSLRRYTGTIPRINPLVLLDVERAQRRLDKLAKRVPLDAPWEAPNAERLDGQTAATWMRRNLATRPGRMLLELAIEAVWAAQPEDMSLLHVLFYIHSAGGLDMLFDTEGGAQQDRFVGGSQLVPIRMAEQLSEERLILGAPVRTLRHGPRRRDRGGRRRDRQRQARDPRDRAHARRPHLLRPAPRRAFATSSPSACRSARSPSAWPSTTSPSGATRACRARARATPAPPSSPSTTHRRTGRPASCSASSRAAGRASSAASRPPSAATAVVDGFARLFGPRAARPDAYVERLWAEEEWSRGCYGCHMPTGAWTAYGPALREPIGPIHWAGAEYATVWNGYMDGAVRSGELAAAQALERM